jgi:hypothetical protein
MKMEVLPMARAKEISKRESRKKAIPVLGAAGLLSLAGGATAATVPAANLPSQGIAPGHQITLGEEEISDVSLATFFVFDKETAGTSELGANVQLARGGCGGRGGGGRGCGGRGCGGRGCGGHGCGEHGCGLRGCGCWGGCGCGCCLSWGGCGLC